MIIPIEYVWLFITVSPFAQSYANVSFSPIGQFQHTQDLRAWSEAKAINEFNCRYCQLPVSTKSTISISFSPCGKYFASTHGDHTVKIISYPEGRIIQTLIGHERTPWTVKFHPTDSNIVASGCLAFDVRVWDINRGQTIRRIKVDRHVVGLDFHPFEPTLVILSFFLTQQCQALTRISTHHRKNETGHCERTCIARVAISNR